MPPFIEISLILVIACAMAWLMQLIRQPLILGHIITGIIAGPLVLNFVHSKDELELFSRIGIAALLFIVGLGLNPRVAREVGAVSAYAGLGQIIFTTLAGFFIASAFGFDKFTSFYIAIALTFSSTIIVLKILTDKQETERLHGKIATGILLVQDLVVTLLLVFLSASKTGVASGNAFTWLLIKGLFLAALLVAVSRWVLPVLARSFARSQEFLFIFAAAWGLGVAAGFQWLGFSIEIGALAAGMALATSPYHYEVSAKMKLLRDFFIIMFFVLIGAQLTFLEAGRLWLPTLVLSLFVLIGNPLILMLIMGILGYNRRIAFLTGITMAQISEFSLVLVVLGRGLGHVGDDAVAVVTFVGLVTIGISSYLMANADRLLRILYPVLGIFERKRKRGESRKREHFDAFLFGCHRLGLDFLPNLKTGKTSYLVVDFDPHMIEHLEDQGVPCRYGDASDDAFLREFDFRHTQLIIITIPDEETVSHLIDVIRVKNRKAIIVATAHRVPEALHYYDLGASYVIMPHFLGGNYASLLMGKYGLDGVRFREEREKHLRHLKNRRDVVASYYSASS